MNRIDLNGIENIIFDLGMVIIDLEMEATNRAFKDLFQDSYDEVFERLQKNGHFNDYETGKISSEDFIHGIAAMSEKDIKGKIPNAWNAMLKKIPDVRFQLLLNAKRRFKTYCLSNTNEMHIEFIYDYLKREKKINNLDNYFHQVYLSHLIKMRKPDAEIFQFVLDQNNLRPEETLFIDDTAGHLEGAKSCGIKTFHLAEGMRLEEVLKF